MPPLPRPSPLAAALLGAPCVALVAWGTLLASGGVALGSACLIAAGAALPAAVAVALVALGRWPFTPPSRRTLAAAVGLATFAAVAAVSAAWSLSPSTSLQTGILAAGYVGALVLGVVVAPILRRPGTVFAIGLAALATAASGAALVARSFAATSGVQFTPRLSGPLAIPNALAGLAVAGMLGGIALGAHRDARLRALGGAVGAVNGLALVLTSSRSGLGLGLLGAAVLVLVLPAAPRMRLTGAIAVLPAIAIGVEAATWDTFERTSKIVTPAGGRLVLATVAAIALGAAVAALAPRLLPGAGRAGDDARAARRVVAGAVAAVALALVAGVIAAGGPAATWDALRAGFTGSVDQTGVRIGIGANLRDHWWSTAWHGFADEPLRGWGAGTFRLLEQTTADPAFTTGSAHDSVLEALAGTGLVGGVPFVVAAIGLLAMAAAGALRPRRDDGAGAAAVAVGATAFLAQGLVDVNWSVAAVGVAMTAAIGAIAPPAGPVRAIAPRWRAGGAVLAAGLLAAGLFALPFWLAARDVTRSAEALRSDPVEALALAARARRADPLATAPRLAEADAYVELGQNASAQAALREAIRLEPANYEPLLAYGTYLAYAWNRPVEARTVLERALRLSGGDASVRGILDGLPGASPNG